MMPQVLENEAADSLLQEVTLDTETQICTLLHQVVRCNS